MSATTTQLLSSGEFCKLHYGTIPVKSASADYLYCCTVRSEDSLIINYQQMHNYMLCLF
jgi:hypothetical protein